MSTNTCSHTTSTPTKVCISQQCNQSTSLICEDCQQQHEHNGTITAVRITKLQDMYKCIMANVQKKRYIRESRQQLLNIRDKINAIIDGVLSGEKEKEGDGDGDGDRQVGGKLRAYLDGKEKGLFYGIWDELKKVSKHAQNSNKQQQQIDLSNIKTQLLQIIQTPLQPPIHKPNPNPNPNPKQPTQSQFLVNLSQIFPYLPLQLKSKPNPSLAHSLPLPAHPSLAQLKILQKLYQLQQSKQQSLKTLDKILEKENLNIQFIARKALLLKKYNKLQDAYDQFCLLIQVLGARTDVDVDLYKMQKAQVCHLMGRYEEAARELQAILGKGKGWRVDKLLAQVRQKQGKIQQAIKLYQKVLQQSEPSHQQKLQIVQNVYQLAKQTKNSALIASSLSSLIILNPDKLEHRLKRASYFHEHKKHDKAIQDYSYALQRVQNVPGLYYNRAVQYIYAGMPEQAIPDLKKAIQLQPKFKEAVHLLATTCFDLLYKNNGKGTIPVGTQAQVQLKKIATNCYQYCLSFYPSNQSICHNLGILSTDKEPQKAYQYFQKAIQLNPKQQASYIGKVKVSIMLKKNPVHTYTDIMALVNLGDRSVSTFLLKALIEEQLEKYQQALETANLILKVDQKNQEAFNTKNRVQQKIKQKTESKDKAENKEKMENIEKVKNQEKAQSKENIQTKQKVQIWQKTESNNKQAVKTQNKQGDANEQQESKE